MKIYRHAFCLFIVLLLLFPSAVLCANTVPQDVLSARSALVRVYCENEDNSVFCGTGFAVGEGGPVKYVVTNRHVTQGSSNISVLCADALKVGATVYLENGNTDLCVLKLSTPVHGLKTLVLDDTGAAKAGDAIYALGFPVASDAISLDISADAEDVTLTDGIISAVKTGKLKENGASVALLQINASLSGGNSGGPLLSENGHVVGINTLAVLDAQNINAAVSAGALADLLSAAGISYHSASEQNAAHATLIIALTAAAAVIISIVILVLLRRRKTHRKNHVSDNFVRNPMRQIEDELQAILPVVKQVRELHRKGRYGFDICPQNIVVSPKGAALRVKSIKLNAGGTITPRPGFSAPEWYTGGSVGPWTDVYAVSALVYHAITGRKLTPAFERSADEVLFDGLIVKYQPLADAISAGLALDITRRQSSLDTLSLQIQACLAEANPMPEDANQVVKSQRSQISCAPDAVQKAVKPERLSGKKKMVVLCVVIGALLLGGTWLVNEVNYAQTVVHIESGEYEEAQRSLKGVFAFYGDTAQLSRYAEAGLKLENGEYESASRLFTELGGYRTAAEMVCEASYRHAQSLLQKGSLAEAEALLNNIGDYKDAAQMRTEIAYQNACTYMDAGLYLSALEAFEAIDPYKDTTARIDDTKGKLYELALSAIKAGDTDTAISSFAAIPGVEQSDTYAEAMNLLMRAKSGGAFTQEEYNAFLRLTDMMDITPYLSGDSLITYYLCGSWQDEKDNVFVMDSDGGIQYNLPGIDGGTYTFQDSIMYMSQSDGTEAPMFGFSCIDMNTMALYCYEDGETYTMTRH